MFYVVFMVMFLNDEWSYVIFLYVFMLCCLMGFDIDYLEKLDIIMLYLGLKLKFGLNECRWGYVLLES